jgi:dihydrofolate reductase
MKLILIAALNKNRVIGRNGKIPWHIPEDIHRFKQFTTHHTVLMGRKTFESIGKPLPNRKNVVVSKNQNLFKSLKIGEVNNTLFFFPSIESALFNFQSEEKVFVIGGGEIFSQTIDRADELDLTIVENDEAGDVFFPPYEHLIGTSFFITSEERRTGMKFLMLRRNVIPKELIRK